MGTSRTLRRIKKYFGWSNLAIDVQKFVRQCIICQCARPIRTRSVTPPGAMSDTLPLSFVSLDFMVIESKSRGNFYIHVAVDHYSRYLVLDVEKTYPTSISVRKFLEERWIRYLGVPDYILTDRGSQYRAGDLTDWVTEELGAKLIQTPPYYPQGNGINESSHQLIKHALRTTDVEILFDDFQRALSVIMMVHNATPTSTTATTPFSLLYGKDMVLPLMHEYTPMTSERVRKASQCDNLSRRLFLCKLRWHEDNYKPVNPGNSVEVGDVVVFPLSDLEKAKFHHLSDIQKWDPVTSFPHRVVHVEGKQAHLRPLWTSDPKRVVALSQLRKLEKTIPRELKDIVSKVLRTPTVPVSTESDIAPFESVSMEEPPPPSGPQQPRKRAKMTKGAKPSTS